MNRLRYDETPGGRFITETEKLYEQNAYRDAFAALVSVFFKPLADTGGVWANYDNFILWGLKVDENGGDPLDLSVTEGAVVINGEIVEVAAVASVAKANASHGLYVTISSSTQEQRPFNNGTLADVQEERVGAIASAASAPADSVEIQFREGKNGSLQGGRKTRSSPDRRGITFLPWPEMTTTERDALAANWANGDIVFNVTTNRLEQYNEHRSAAAAMLYWQPLNNDPVHLTTTQRDAITDWALGSIIWNSSQATLNRWNGVAWFTFS